MHFRQSFLAQLFLRSKTVDNTVAAGASDFKVSSNFCWTETVIVFAEYVFTDFWRQWLPPDVWPSLVVHQRHFAVCSDKSQNLEDIFKIPSRFTNNQLSSLNYFSLVSRITMTCLELRIHVTSVDCNRMGTSLLHHFVDSRFSSKTQHW